MRLRPHAYNARINTYYCFQELAISGQKKIFSETCSWSLETELFLGSYSEGVTPVPIPNTAVKSLSADGTARATVWESRTLPGLILKPCV